MKHALILGTLLAISSQLLAAPQASALNLSPLPQAQPETRLAQHLEDQLNTYLEGLLERDASAMLDVLSSERKARLFHDLNGESIDSRTLRFIDHEAEKLERVVGFADDFAGMHIQAIEELEQEGVVAVTLTYRDQILPKPFYFVEEDGQWLLNVVAPRVSPVPDDAGNKTVINGCDTGGYTVKNSKSANFTFYFQGCKNDSWAWSAITAPAYTTIGFNAVDTCSTGWDATQFKYSSSTGTKYIKCDYESFSDDAYVGYSSSSGYYLACYDPC